MSFFTRTAFLRFLKILNDFNARVTNHHVRVTITNTITEHGANDTLCANIKLCQRLVAATCRLLILMLFCRQQHIVL